MVVIRWGLGLHRETNAGRKHRLGGGGSSVKAQRHTVPFPSPLTIDFHLHGDLRGAKTVIGVVETYLHGPVVTYVISRSLVYVRTAW